MFSLSRDPKVIARRLLWVSSILGVLVVATVVKAGVNGFSEGMRKDWGCPSGTAEQARKAGMLVYRVHVEPKTLHVDGQEVHFHGGWLESASDDGWSWVWFPKKIRTGSYYLTLIADMPASLWGSEFDKPRWFLPRWGIPAGDAGSNFLRWSEERPSRWIEEFESLESLPTRFVLTVPIPGTVSYREIASVELRFQRSTDE